MTPDSGINDANDVKLSRDNAAQHTVLRQQIQQSLQKANLQKNKLKTLDRRYSVTNLILSAVATFIARESAIAGEPMLGNWRATTLAASFCTLGATVVAGVHKQVAPTDLIIETSECAAKLKALKIETIPAEYALEEVTDVYQGLLAEYSRVDC